MLSWVLRLGPPSVISCFLPFTFYLLTYFYHQCGICFPSINEHLHQAFQINGDLTLLKMNRPTNNKLEVLCPDLANEQGREG